MNWKYNLGLKFKDIAQKNSNKLAIIIDNKRYNFKYLENKSFKVSKYFVNNLKLKPGDVVALDSTKCIEAYIFLIACLRIGEIHERTFQQSLCWRNPERRLHR